MSSVASLSCWLCAERLFCCVLLLCCFGVVFGGPPASVQIRRSLRPSLSSRISQSTVTVPVSFDSAPYLAALVAISCTIIDSTTASRGDNGTFGPLIRMRSGLYSKNGCSARPMISFSSDPCHFSWLRILCASASAPSRRSYLLRSFLLALR